MLLLDEADVFMESRTSHNIESNMLSCVLLRHIESYDGVIFLTSNRCNTIDSAFFSRITLSLFYKSLTDEARFKVFKQILSVYDNDLHESDLIDLAKYELNGRQINTIVKSAYSVAREEKTNINKSHLETFINYSLEFLEMMK